MKGEEPHSIDPRELLGQVHHQGHDELLAVQRGAHQAHDGHLLLLHGLLLLLLHPRDVFGGVVLPL